MPQPLPTRGARGDELEELAHAVRRDLLGRGEAPPPGWVDEVTRDLQSGRMHGWYYPAGGGLAFGSVRGDRAFGHVHVAAGEEDVGRAESLLRCLQEELPPTAQSLDVGFTGLTPERERSLADRLRGGDGVTLLAREAMERTIEPSDAEPVESIPPGIHLRPIRAIPREALTELDYRAFEGTIDANLIGSERAEYRRMMDELIEGRLGRFLEEASTALVGAETEELVGAILTSEQTPQLAVYLDIMVAPGHRREGLGRYLVRWGFRALWALGYPKVRLWVTESNASARALYRSVGFTPVGTALIYRFYRGRPAGAIHRPGEGTPRGPAPPSGRG